MKSPICRDPALSYWPPGILGDHFFQQLIPVHPAIQNCISNWTYKLKETKRILIMMMMTKMMMEERFRLRAGSSCFSSQKPCFPPPQTNVSLWWWFANAWQRYEKVSNLFWVASRWSKIEIWFSGDSTKTVGLHCNLRSILIGQRIQERSWLGEKDRCWHLNPEWIISRLTQSQLTTTTIYIRHCQFSFSDQH